MKVLAAPINYDHRQEGQLHALRHLGEVVEFDFIALDRTGQDASEKFVAAVAEHQPDWCWLQLQDTDIIKADAIASARTISPETVFVTWTGDIRHEVSKYQTSICRVADLTLTSAGGHLPMFIAAGARDARYLQIGLDWHEDVLGEPEWVPPFRVPDVVFCGQHYGHTFDKGSAERVGALCALRAANIDVAVVGGFWPNNLKVVGACTVKQQLHVYRRAKVALSVSHFNDVERYHSDRFLIALASGTPVVAKRFPGWHWDFRDCALFYDNHDQLVSLVEQLLADEELRRQLGARGRAEAIARHTWTSRMLEVAAMVDGIRAGRRSP